MQIEFHSQTVGDTEVFHRVAGPADAPVLLLLRGFPTVSHLFRDLIPHLAGRYPVIAPDLPGFGNTRAPARGTYSFDRLAQVIEGFTQALHRDRYALYICDYGPPVGLGLAMAHPERAAAIISQNGDADIAGLSDAWALWRAYWASPTAKNREARRASLSPETIRSGQYLHDADASLVLLDTGHFALETHAAEIGEAVRRFLANHVGGRLQ